MRYAVVIAGAGPAGVSCAVALKRRNPSLSVLVVDRAHFPRAKACGGGLTGHADEAMAALGLVLDVPTAPAGRARVRCGALVREVTLQRPVRIVRREELDASLVRQARALGVEVREGVALADFAVDADGVRVDLAGEVVVADVLIGADGAGSLVRKRLLGERRAGAPEAPRARPIRLFRHEQAAPAGWPDDEMLYDFTPMVDGLRGYLWVFPVPGGRVNVGLMHDPDRALSGGELTDLLGRYLARLGVPLDGAARGWPAWGYQPAQAVSAPRVLLCGDAAGIDALTGEGIAVGMEQALVAAEAVVNARARGDFRFAGYRRALRRATVGRELALDRRLAAMLYRRERWRRWLPLVLFDDKMLDLYAARVCGSLVLADEKSALVGAFTRHLWHGRGRARALETALGGSEKA